MSEARDEILARIRRALGPSPTVPEVPRGYRRRGVRSPRQRRTVFAQRLSDYRATVALCGWSEQEIAAALSAVLGDHGIRSVVAPPLVASAWLGQAARDGVSVTVDTGQVSTAALDRVGAVVTGAALGIAETGVVVLDGGAWCGRRAITLVPDVHVCVVPGDHVVDTVPEAVSRLDPTTPQTWIAGPSATSDIELDRVEGVHGPRTLIVILAG